MAKPRKILYIQPNSETGGSDHCLFRLVCALDRCRYEPVVVLPQNGPMTPLFERIGVKVRFQQMAQLRTIPSLHYQTRYLARFWPTVAQLAGVIRDERIDIVHTNSLYSLYGAWAARRARRPHVWHVREIPPAVPIALPFFGKMVLTLSTTVMAMSHACVRGLSLAKPASGKVKVVADGIDLNEFRPEISGQRIRRDLGITMDTPVVGFVGRLDPWKGLEVFLHSVALLQGQFTTAHFVVAGGAPSGFEHYERRMRALVVSLRLSDRLHFLGWRYRLGDIPELMAALTVLSHTATRPEPFGLVLIEAMAMQRPIVAARAGGPLEIVLDSESGYLTPPGDPQAHARAVATLLQNSEQAQRMGRAGRRRVEEMFRIERFKQELTTTYEKVLEGA